MFDIDGVILWLQQNPEWVAWGLFFAAFVESFAIIGIFVPGVVLLAIISGMAASADMNVASVLIIVYSASCIADISSYFIGMRLHKRIDSIWPFRTNPGWLIKGREFFKVDISVIKKCLSNILEKSDKGRKKVTFTVLKN